MGLRSESKGRLIGALAGLALLWGVTACDTQTPTNLSVEPAAPGIADYFPMQAGYSASFIVRDSSGAVLRTEHYFASSATTFDGYPGVNWNGDDGSGETEESIIYSTGVAVYQTTPGAVNSEQLISEPLEVGASWARWVSEPTDTLIVDSDGSGDGHDSGGLGVVNEDKPNDGNEPAGSSFPTKGNSTFFIASVDDVVVSGGQVFEDCLQVVNAGNGYSVNRYWYSPGNGMVKYALNCLSGSMSGAVNAELID